MPIPEARVKKLAREILKGEKFSKNGSINICFTDNSLIKKLNSRFLNACGATDVLAFNLDNTDRHFLADIAVSAEKAISSSRSFKTSPVQELLLYVTHGILHIIGFNDRNHIQIKLMRKKEREYADR